MRRKLAGAIVALLVAAATPSAAAGWPHFVAPPPGIDLRVRPLREVSYERLNVHDSNCEQRFFFGRLWETFFFVPDNEARPIEDNWKDLWEKWRTRLLAQGWEETCVEYVNGYGLKRTIGSVEFRLAIGLGDRDEVDVGVVRVGDPPMLLLALPPFDLSETSDWPWAPRAPGAVPVETAADPEFSVYLGTDEIEDTVQVSPKAMKRCYRVARTISAREMETSYFDALRRAGWDTSPLRPNQAHYTKDGRSVWIGFQGRDRGLRGPPDEHPSICVSVADPSRDDWLWPLTYACRAPLWGVDFDYEKTSLKAGSSFALEKTLALVKSRPRTKLELRVYSEGEDSEPLGLQRAGVVRDWLVARGVPAESLVTRGFAAESYQQRRTELACAP